MDSSYNRQQIMWRLLFFAISFGLLGGTYHEYRRYSGLYIFCQRDIKIYETYLETDICATPKLRSMFERLGMVKCSEIEELLLSETPFDCAYKSWIVKGPIGKLLGLINDLNERMMSSFTIISTLVSIIAICVVYQYRKQQETIISNQRALYFLGTFMAKSKELSTNTDTYKPLTTQNKQLTQGTCTIDGVE